jgi:hypothetical protein
MRKTDFAEWLLSLTTTPERAASTAGDLQEEASTRGASWFWISLLRTAGALVWDNVSESPLRITGLAFLSVLFSWLSVVAYSVLIATGQLLLVGIVLWAQDLRIPRDFPNDALMTLDSIVALLLASMRLGGWLTKWAPRRELAVSLVAWVGSLAVWTLLSMAWPFVVTPWGPREVALHLALTAGCALFTYAGIERSRRRLATC